MLQLHATTTILFSMNAESIRLLYRQDIETGPLDKLTSISFFAGRETERTSNPG